MIVGIVLAAGASTRMGRPKALLPIGTDRFVTRVCRTLVAGGISDIVIVAGPEADSVRDVTAEAGLAVRVVTNPRRDEGQLTSLLAGLAEADRPGVEGVLVHLVDSPLVTPATVRSVVDAFRHGQAAIVRPAVDGRHGHPVLFGRRLFDELRRSVHEPLGAKAVVRAHAAESCTVPVPDEGACRDIDTREDYEQFIGPWPDTA
ncbi:MAG: nucleotidyltransferase family protein [Acidobacteria bacterium]|nr:nucleotidyltransferase family protein [Acidobacteriota bacterium]